MGEPDFETEQYSEQLLYFDLFCASLYWVFNFPSDVDDGVGMGPTPKRMHSMQPFQLHLGRLPLGVARITNIQNSSPAQVLDEAQ